MDPDTQASPAGPSDHAGDAIDALPSSTTVHAMFEQEVAAQEAMGLLVHHGFRQDRIRLLGAAGRRWRVSGSRPSTTRLVSRRHVVVGLAVGTATAALYVLLVGRLPPSATWALIVMVGAAVGASVGALAGTRNVVVPGQQVLSPDHGCVVAVRTLRSDDARLVLDRADGVAVAPVDDGDDAPSSDTTDG